MSWEAAKKSTLAEIKNLPDYTPEDILREYTQLLSDLKDKEIMEMPVELRAFTMHRRFPKFALAYTGLFNIACRRASPIPISLVKSMLETATAKENGLITEEKARGIVMDIAEGHRRKLL